jgi:hypothetical protein
MLTDLRLGEEFFLLVAGLDAQIARQVAAGGCRWCRGPLHQANYPRKPRGGWVGLTGEAFTLRHSLCCGREGCRRRCLPPSLRFLGRRVYLGAVVLLATVVTQLVATLREARRGTGVPGRTLRRWQRWWRGEFVHSPTWLQMRARFAPPPPQEGGLPASLWARLEAEVASRPPGETPLAEVCLFGARLLAWQGMR